MEVKEKAKVMKNEKEERIDHEKMARELTRKYREKFGKAPGPAAQKAMECFDEEFIGKYFASLIEVEKSAQNNVEFAEAKIRNVNQELERAKIKIEHFATTTQRDFEKRQIACEQREEAINIANSIQNQNAADALKMYQTIVSMNFGNEEQKLENIKNASYVVWAVFFQGDGGPGKYFEKSQSVSKIKEPKSKRDIDWAKVEVV